MITQVFQSANTNRELALIDTNLRRQNEQFKRMEISWVEEKHKLVQKNRSLQRAVRRKYTHATNEIKRLEGLLKAAEYSKAYEKKKKENLQATLENTLDEFKLQRKIWRLEEEKRTAELKEMQKKCQEQEAVMIKKEKLITMYKRELLALAKENLQTGIRLKDEHDQSVRGWKLKYEALEARLREELAKKGWVKKVSHLFFIYMEHFALEIRLIQL